MKNHLYVACDLGAESGRVMTGKLVDGRLLLEELHRFPTGASNVRGTLRWDVVRIFEEIKIGLRKVAGVATGTTSVSVDSWGVDYVLFNKEQPMLSIPYHYRDSRVDSFFADAQANHRELIFGETGIQFMPFNSLFQLMSEATVNRSVLGIAERFLFIADYVNYLLSGVESAEETLASTSQAYNPKKRAWSEVLIEKFDLPKHIFPPVHAAGTRLGPLQADVAEATGLKEATVVATCSHDTGAAVAAVPASGDDWAYLSSGTWSLIGVELPSPLISPEILAADFTNELGVNGTVRFLKNIVGLWILQECRRTWEREGNALDYGTLTRLASEAEPFRSIVHPNSPCFARPDKMPTKVAEYCKATGQPVPETPGQYVRAILEGLALLYGQTLGTIEQLTGRTIRRLHIVGGGSQSDLLNQFAANATGREVIAGPVEATAMGNLLVQALALGHIGSLDELREVVSRSVEPKRFSPENAKEWADARVRFAQLRCDL